MCLIFVEISNFPLFYFLVFSFWLWAFEVLFLLLFLVPVNMIQNKLEDVMEINCKYNIISDI